MQLAQRLFLSCNQMDRKIVYKKMLFLLCGEMIPSKVMLCSTVRSSHPKGSCSHRDLNPDTSTYYPIFLSVTQGLNQSYWQL